jgi:2-polyprenyl-6-methoxyphenol hydroxylase-like FAD-dependent oxidoreductase
VAEAARPNAAVVIGGNIGGLTAAMALRQAGFDPIVFERRDDLHSAQAGGGIVLWHGAMRALQQVGLAERVRAAGTPCERVENRTRHGELLRALPMRQLHELMGGPAVIIGRTNLQFALAEALEEGVLQLGAEVVDLHQDDTGVTVGLADGRKERGDLLIAADGRGSLMRTKVGKPPSLEMEYTGYVVWDGVADMDHEAVPPGELIVLWDHAIQFHHFYIEPRRLQWAVYEFGVPENVDLQDGPKETLLRRFRGWPTPVEALLEATDGSTIRRRVITRGPPLDTWGKGRVALLGDAAHPLTPTLGLGGGQAIEDALVLGRCLVADSDVVSALRAYEAARKPRILSIMKLQKNLDASAATRSRLPYWLRNQVVKFVFNRPTLLRRTAFYRAMSFKA